MRILILTTYFLPDSSANGILMKQLASDLKMAGHKLTVLTTFPHYDNNRIAKEYQRKLWIKEVSDEISIIRLYLYVPKRKDWLLGRMFSYSSWNVLSALAGLFAGHQDIVFVPSPPLTNGLVGHLLSRLLRVPFVYNVQDIYPDIAVQLGVLKKKRTIRTLRALEDFVYNKASAITVISDGFKQNLLSKGVPENKLWVIPNFANIDFIHPLPRMNSVRTKLGLADRFVVLYAGNVGLSQGLECVLGAAALLKTIPEITYLIVGNGAARTDLAARSLRMGLLNVKFHPFLSYEEIPEMYASADVGLVSLKRGIKEESVPSKIFTILAAGKPVIASVDEDNETWRLVNEAHCGMCIRPEDPSALAKVTMDLFLNRESGRRMGLRGRKYVEEKHSSKRIAKEYEILFERIVRLRN